MDRHTAGQRQRPGGLADEWLNAQAAGGYLGYHAVSDTDELSPEQALVLTHEDSALYVPPAWDVPAAMGFDETTRRAIMPPPPASPSASTSRPRARSTTRTGATA